ncbi:MAG: endolytic transglycosylase MltG [Thermoflavifilum sp.]|nr:endolytic transglycosylase MltG [Thermoflavifilum sp.]
MVQRRASRPRKKTQQGHYRSVWLIFIIVALSFAGYFAYRIFRPNTYPFQEKTYVYIPTGATYKQVLKELKDQHIVRNIRDFDWLARKLHYPQHIHPGRYRISPGMSNLQLVRLLYSGRQTPVRLVIGKLRTKKDLIRLVSHHLEADSASMATLLSDQVYLRQYGLDTNTALCVIIPNTYFFFWNTSAEGFFKRMYHYYQRFWDSTRLQEAQKIGLSPIEVIILASIVEEETAHDSEKPLIASVYLNRLQRGMPLAADPTVKYAIGDFSLRRIYSKYTRFDSPYNTYLYKGLPPGPICTPSPASIDAVLHAPRTNYLYFCAKADFSGYHTFASSYVEHLKNARKYQAALDSLHIE